MSTDYNYTNGLFHLCLRAKGYDKQMAFFHRLMYKIDSDWPWLSFRVNGEVSLCSTCHGVCVRNPRFGAEDIKAAGHQAGLKIVKVDRFSLECVPNAGIFGAHINLIPHAEAVKLLGIKAKNIRVIGDRVFHKSQLGETVEGGSAASGSPPVSKIVELLPGVSAEVLTDEEEAALYSVWGNQT